MKPFRRGSTIGGIAAIALAASARILVAQTTAAQVSGTILSTDGERIVGADVRVIGAAGPAAISEEDGTFALFVAGSAMPRLAIRRVGFTPDTVSVGIPQDASQPLVVHLMRTPLRIRPVVVSATMAEANTTIGGVHARARRAGNGYFLFRDQFMRSNPVEFTDILRHVPGVRFVRTPTDPQALRLRQNPCSPLFWVDGVALPGIPFDPNSQPVNSIEAIEVYAAPETVPPQFEGPAFAQGCGSIVVWTRRGERRPRTPKIGIDSIMRLIAAQRIFVAAEVDRPAAVLRLPEPQYPDSLLATGVGGSAVIELIVEADGSPNEQSIGIVSATHVAFADAARVAVRNATFRPAMKDDRPVAQLFHLPVTFTPPKPPPEAR